MPSVSDVVGQRQDPLSPQSAKVLFGDHTAWNSKNDPGDKDLPIKVTQDEEPSSRGGGKENSGSSFRSPTDDQGGKKQMFSSPTEPSSFIISKPAPTPRSILKKPRYTSYSSLEMSQESVEEEDQDCNKSGNSSRKRKNFDESATKHVSVKTPSRKRAKSTRHGPSSSLQTKDILSRAALLFPESADRIRHMPVISARVFACFTLHQDQQLAAPTPKKTKQLQALTPMTRRRRQSQLLSRTGSQEMEPLKDLLTALVELELVSLDQATPKKLVHFNAHDGSAIKPAVDVISGSSAHQKKCIRLIHNALMEVEAVDCIPQLHLLCTFLQNLKEDTYQQLTVANSIEGYDYYDSSRVQTAVELYLEDFQIMVDRLSQSRGVADDKVKYKPLSLETMLSDKCGKSIRYMLRSIFNPVPYRACFDNETRISNFIDLHSDHESTVVDEDNLSSLVSNALRNMYDLFGKYVLDDMEIVLKNIKDMQFCETSICLGGVGTKAIPVVLNKDDWEEVHHEVWRASRFLSAYEGARFLQELLSIRVVVDELESRVDEWDEVRKYASILEEIGQDDELHFAYLSAPLDQLSGNLSCLVQALNGTAEYCYDQLQSLHRRFKLGKKDASRVKSHLYRKQIRNLAEVFEEAQEVYTYFPYVLPAKI